MDIVEEVEALQEAPAPALSQRVQEDIAAPQAAPVVEVVAPPQAAPVVQPAPPPQAAPVVQPAPPPQAVPVVEAAPVVAPPPPSVSAPTLGSNQNAAPTIAPPAPEVIAASKSLSFQGPDLTAGRVATLQPEGIEDIASVRILSDPDFGRVTVNPDNTLAVVLSHSSETGRIAFSYEVTRTDGTVETYATTHTVVEGPLEGGWGAGKFYMLETDENDDVVVEHGDDHRKVYISGSDDALSRADIAALEGLRETDITATWLTNNPEYGGSEDMALDIDAGLLTWNTIVSAGDRASSNWLLFEKGYSYDVPRLVGRGVDGESALHPLHITSYGDEGDAIIDTPVMIFQELNENIVISDLRFSEQVMSLSGQNIIFDGNIFDWEVSLQRGDGFTLRNSIQYDVVAEDPQRGGDQFDPHGDRLAGLYMADANGVLLEGNLWDRIAWEEGFTYDGDAEFGQAPSKYSHNVYLQNNVLDTTFRDNISMRAASFGLIMRGGGYVEDNVLLDNNAHISLLDGSYNTGPIGNYSLFTGNVVTSAAYKDATQIGAKAWGVRNDTFQASFIDNIVAHMSNPDDPDDAANKPYGDTGVTNPQNAYYDNSIIYNWSGEAHIARGDNFDRNVEGLDRAILDQTTIQRFAAELLGKPDATIGDLGEYLRANALAGASTGSDSELIRAFFFEGFGIEIDTRLEAETLRFVPNDLADGIRWDNRLNWDTGDLPGTLDGDSVNLAGNWVNYGGTTTIEDLSFGAGGRLNVSHGKLTVDGTTKGTDGAELNISNAGQIWLDGIDAGSSFEINVDGGRFANTGEVAGTTKTWITDGQALLATDGAAFDLEAGSVLGIEGSEAKVGFEGTTGDTGVLRLEAGSVLHFEADANGFSAISEMRSGAYDQDTADIQSGVNLGLSTLSIDITALGGTASQHVLMKADAVIGDLKDVHLIGLSDWRDAELVIDHMSDTVQLNLWEEGRGSGAFEVRVVEETGDGDTSADLWAALTAGQPVYEDALPTEAFTQDELDYETLLVA